MYRMMIVEDEPWIRKGIEKAVPWPELGIEYVGYASNGEEALLKLDEFLPDILLTDIMMPKMNGIELIGKIYEQWSNDIKVVILTGYNEFEYAREAIRYNVVDYLLKPIDPAELREIMLKITRILDEKRARSLQMLRLEIGNSIYGHFLGSDEEQSVGLDLAGYHVCIVYAMNRISADTLKEISDADPILEFPVGYATIYVLCFANPHDARRFIEESSGLLSRKFTAGVGGIAASGEESFREALSDAYASMQRALLVRSSAESQALQPWIWNAETDKEIVALLRRGDQGEIHRYIRNLVQSAKGIPQKRAIAMHLLMFFERFGHCSAWLRDAEWTYPLLTANSEEAIQAFLDEYILPAADGIAAEWRRDHSSIAAGVLRYIDEHFDDPNLSLSEIAARFNVSTSYLSHIFKNELSINYVTYLTHKRVERAKELLVATQDQIYHICRAVGYYDVKYFIRVFKKMTGMTPKQYRENLAKRR